MNNAIFVSSITNWAGNLTYSAKTFHRPTSLEGVQQLINESKKIKAFGTRHSFSNIADCPDQIISSDAWQQVITLDKVNHTVTVGAGIRYGELAVALHKEGYALHNLASLPHISVAGACATATHGSGDLNGNLATAVKGLKLIKGNGELINLSEKDADFAGAVVNLGALGMVTEVTLAIQPTYQIQQEIFENLPLSHALEHFNDIFSSGYSVSFFTDYNKEVINQVWLKRRLVSGTPLVPIQEFYGARAATRNMHPISSAPALNCTDQMAIRGAWHERLPHFKLDFTPSNGEELQTEYFVDRSMAPEAFKVIQAMHSMITPLLFIAEIRSIKADQLWMSTAYGGDKIAFHFTWKPLLSKVLALLPKLEEALEPFMVRPHWAKLFHLEADKIGSLYPKIAEFRELMMRYDPDRKFRNPFLESKLG